MKTTVHPNHGPLMRSLVMARMRTRALTVFTVVLVVASGSAFGGMNTNEIAAQTSSVCAASPHWDRLVSGNGMNVRLSRGRIETSSDGMNWTERPLTIRTFLRGVTYGNGMFVAVGGSYFDEPGVIVTSRDSIVWKRRNSRTARNLYGVTFHNGQFVAVGDEGVIVVSNNGITWKPQRSGTQAMLATVVHGSGLFVAGGESGTILTSSDGLQWKAADIGQSVFAGTVHFHDGTFIVKARADVLTSKDGLAWHGRDEANDLTASSFPQNATQKKHEKNDFDSP